MTNWKSSFSFAIFFTGAIKENTHLFQYDAVNALLIGSKYSNTNDNDSYHISPNMTSHYALGGKPIRKEIISKVLDLSSEERIQRITSARIVNIKKAITCLKQLLVSEHIVMDSEKRKYFLEYPSDLNPECFLGDMFLEAILCSRTDLIKIDGEIISDILAFRENTKDIFTLDGNQSHSSVDNISLPTVSTENDAVKTKGEFDAVVTIEDKEVDTYQKFQTPDFLINGGFKFRQANIKSARLDFPKHRELVAQYLYYYGSSADRPFTIDEVSKCLDYCDNYRNSFIMEILGSCHSVVDAIIYRIAPRSCAHITIMAEARNMRGLLTLRDMISDIYFYSANSTAPLFFSFKFSQDLDENDYRVRIIFSEQPSVEGMERNKLFASPYAADLSKYPGLSDLVPAFFTHFPERNYYMMPLGPEYDPDMDQTDEAYSALRILLKDGRSNIY